MKRLTPSTADCGRSPESGAGDGGGDAGERCLAALLPRLRNPDDPEAWTLFVHLYSPLLRRWARRLGFSTEDAADRVQDVLLLLVSKLREFQYDPQQSFLGWLWTVFRNRCREDRRRPDGLDGAAHGQAEQAGPDTTADRDEVEEREHRIGRAMRLIQAVFPETYWRACWESVACGRPAAEVARDLGMSIDLVYQAKARVLRRLREEFGGLLD